MKERQMKERKEERRKEEGNNPKQTTVTQKPIGRKHNLKINNFLDIITDIFRKS